MLLEEFFRDEWKEMFINFILTKKEYIQYISENPNINIDFILKHKDEKFNWSELSRNPGIFLKDIENNLELNWKWDHMSLNPNLNIKFVLKYKDKDFSLYGISRNPGIFMKDIEEYPAVPAHCRDNV